MKARIVNTDQTSFSKADQRKRLALFGLLFPGSFWLIVFFILPLMIIVVYSLLSRTSTGAVTLPLTFDNYAKLFGDPIYLGIFWRSLWMAVVTTLLCLVIGYPLAYVIARSSPRWRTLLIFAIMIPFWTNFLVRIYAWRFLLNNTGLINTMLEWLGLPQVALINSTPAVLLGLVYGELPFMVLPLYASLVRFDWSLLEAAHDLYASRWRAMLHVLLPLSLPGVVAGVILVFIPTAGSFVVPELLGGSKIAMLGNTIERQFKSAQHAPFGSAIALIFMLLLTGMIAVYVRMSAEVEQ